jgi:hypothetical protein
MPELRIESVEQADEIVDVLCSWIRSHPHIDELPPPMQQPYIDNCYKYSTDGRTCQKWVRDSVIKIFDAVGLDAESLYLQQR